MNIGKLNIDFQRYCTQANSILGIRGSGKTYSATYLAEQLLDWGCPICVIDPSGTWKNLKTPNGESGRSYDVVTIGGDDSDIFVDDSFDEEKMSNIVSKAIRENVSLIFDLYRTDISKEKWGLLLTSAFQTLYLKNKNIRHIFVEESATFIPQNQKAFSKDLYNILEEITRIGGNCQLGITFISQRAEQLNKQCLELCDLMLLHRQRGNNSLKTIGKWLGMGVVSNEDIEMVLGSIPTLESGEAWVLEQESKNPHRINIPTKNSLHPDRKRFDESFLVKSKMADVRNFIDDTNSLGKEEVIYTQPKPVYNTPIFIQEEKPVEIELPDIDSMELSAYEKNIGYVAGKTPFANSNVRSTIDGLVRKGYTIYNEYPFYLRNVNNNKTFGLNSDIERKYAKLITKLVTKNT